MFHARYFLPYLPFSLLGIALLYDAVKKIDNVAVLVPAYQPGPALTKLISNLVHNFETIIIINDGSTTDQAKEAFTV